MPVDNLQDYPIGSLFTFDKVFKGHPAGTVAELKEIVNVSGLIMSMVALPDQPDVKPFSMHPKMFSPAEGTTATGGEQSIEGAVLDLFMNHANMEHQLALNFIGAYIAQGDKDDVGTISLLMDQNDLKVGKPWTMAQTAKLYADFLELFELEGDDLIDTVLAEEEAKVKAAAKKPPAQTTTAAKPTTLAPAPKPSATVPAAEAKGRVDRDSWTPTRMDAFRAAGLLMQIYSESPDNFDAIIALAVRMVKQADTVRDTSK